MLRAFEGIQPANVRVVILGQDPYPNPAWATGRAFEQGNLSEWTTSPGRIAHSLRRIVQALVYARTKHSAYTRGDRGWKAVRSDLKNGLLTIEPPLSLFDHLEREGVLFLNTSLTLGVDMSSGRPKVASRHIRLWEPVLFRVLTFIATRKRGHVLFLLWGADAAEVVERSGICAAARSAGTWRSGVRLVRHPHPAAVTSKAAAFLCPPNPFLKANTLLLSIRATPMEW
jgi:uracil-DNA glycosylase